MFCRFIALLFIQYVGAAYSFAKNEYNIYGFDPIPADSVVQGEVYAVTNVPPLAMQGSFGICYAATAATMLTAETCRETKQDCRNLKKSDVFSALDLSMRFSHFDKDLSNDYTPMFDGGSTANTLQIIAYQSHWASSEECTSLDRITEKMGGANVAGSQIESQLAFWAWLKKQYSLNHAKAVECPACFVQNYEGSDLHSGIEAHLTISQSAEGITKAFSKDSYEEFLKRLLLDPQCARAKNSAFLEGNASVQIWPDKKKARGTYGGAVEQVKQVLSDGRLLALGAICLDKNPSKIPDKCKNSHQVAISGFKRVCEKSGKKCADAVQVLNSWGPKWQADNSDGWVYAKPLFDRTTYKQATLTWFKDKPRE